jgi:hypothetical protein
MAVQINSLNIKVSISVVSSYRHQPYQKQGQS